MSVLRVAPFGPTWWTPGPDGLQGQCPHRGRGRVQRFEPGHVSAEEARLSSISVSGT